MLGGFRRVSFIALACLAACTAPAANALTGEWGASDFSQNRGLIGLDFSSKGIVTITSGGMARTVSTSEYDASKPGVLVIKSSLGQEPLFYKIDGDVLTLSQHEDFSEPMTLRRGVPAPTMPPYKSKI
jgi:hypothetical protein